MNSRKTPVLTVLYHSDGLNTSLYTPCSPNKNNPTYALTTVISVSNAYLRYALLVFLFLGSHLPLINLLLYFYGACSQLWITSGSLGIILDQAACLSLQTLEGVSLV